MNIMPVNQSQNFKGLNLNYLMREDMDAYVRKDWKKLQELGKKYDIRLVSCYANVPCYSAIDIDVRPLKTGMSFFKRLFRPTGRSTFCHLDISPDEKIKPSVLDSVEEAIADLKSKISK